MSGQFSTKSWLIGIALASFIVSAIIGMLHESGVFTEDINPLLHILRDGTVAAIVSLPSSYLITKLLAGKNKV